MTLYWRFFNFFVRRVVAIAFIIGGIVLTASGIPSILPGGTINVDGIPSDDLVFRWVAFLLPLVLAAFGVALYRAKPYIPIWRKP
ncbi:hypothetical protein ABT364_03375 [Massilia sp. SR12]